MPLFGSPTDFSYTPELDYWYKPERIAEIMKDPGVPEVISATVADYLEKQGKTLAEVSLHYCVSKVEEKEKISGACVIFPDNDYQGLGHSLACINFGDIMWDGVRRCLEILGEVQFIHKPLNLVFDYNQDELASFRQLNLSFIWNKDLLPYAKKLVDNNILNEAHLLGLSKTKNIQVLLQAMAETASLAIPTLKGRLIFDS